MSNKENIRVTGRFPIYVDGQYRACMQFKARHHLAFINLYRQGHPTAQAILDGQIEKTAEMLVEKTESEGHCVQVGVGLLLIFDKMYPDYSTWWAMT